MEALNNVAESKKMQLEVLSGYVALSTLRSGHADSTATNFICGKRFAMIFFAQKIAAEFLL